MLTDQADHRNHTRHCEDEIMSTSDLLFGCIFIGGWLLAVYLVWWWMLFRNARSQHLSLRTKFWVFTASHGCGTSITVAVVTMIMGHDLLPLLRTGSGVWVAMALTAICLSLLFGIGYVDRLSRRSKAQVKEEQ